MKKTIFVFLSAFIMFAASSYSQDLSIKETIKNLQNKIEANGAKWVAGETELSGLSREEQLYRVGLDFRPVDAPPIGDLASEDLPASLDWRNFQGKNYVTGIRNQGKCGSCWAFAMTAALEAYTLIDRGIPGTDLDLSEQVMLSCSGTGSCNGGYINPSYIKKTGLPEESFYPYSAADGSCSSAAPGWQEKTYKIYSYGSVNKDVNSLKAALNKYGPLPTAMMVYEDFMHYKSGIYSYVEGKKLGGHAVFLVGYNDQEQYFIVKNSWGENWGEKGYFKIAYSELNSKVSFGMSSVAYKRAFKTQDGEKNYEGSVTGDALYLEKYLPAIRPIQAWIK